MRYVLKIISLAGLIVLCIFGAAVIWQSNDLQRFLPQQTQETDPMQTPAQEPNTTKNPDGDAVTFRQPVLYVDGQEYAGSCDVVYIHENGFEVGKKTYRDQTATPSVTYDEQGRLSGFSVRITPDTLLMYSVAPAEGAAFVNHEFADQAPLVPVTDHTWRDAMHPYLTNIASYVKESGNDVVMVINLEYDGENDRAPHYIDLKAFSVKDLGATCSVWATFYNYDPKQQVDYVHMTYYGQATAEQQPVTETEGGDANG